MVRVLAFTLWTCPRPYLCLHQALVKVRDTVSKGGRVLFVGTKRQASQPIAEAAQRCAQYYMNHRWLGGTLTNWSTVSNSIKRLRELEETLGGKEQSGFTKKELLNLERDREKAGQGAGRDRQYGRSARPDLSSSTPIKKRLRSKKRVSSAFRSSLWSIPIATRMMRISPSQAMMMRPARFRFTATGCGCGDGRSRRIIGRARHRFRRS